MSRIILLTLIFLLPLFFWPSPLKFELAKVILLLSAGFFLVLDFLLKIKPKNFEKYYQKIDKIWFLWVGILFLSSLINQTFPHGFLFSGYRHESVLFFFLLGIFALTIRMQKTKSLKQILKLASVAIIVETLIIYAQWLMIKFNFPILSSNQRPIGTFGEPNAVAGFLVLGLPILFTSLQQPLIPITAVILAILFTGSKAGILALLAELITFVFLWKKKFPYKKMVLISSLILILIIGILGVYSERNESHFENRWLIWNLGLKAAREKPLLGYGAEGIINAYDQQFHQIELTLVGLAIDRSHNLFLDIILFSGIIGLVAFSLWLWKISQELINKKSWVLVSLVGFLIFSFFQPIGVTHWFYLIFLISLANP